MYRGFRGRSASRVRGRTDLSAEGVFTVVGVGISDLDLSSSVERCGIRSNSIKIDSVSSFDISEVKTDCFICIDREMDSGWLSDTIANVGLPRPIPDASSIETGVIYDTGAKDITTECRSVAIVVTVFNRPDVAIQCVESIISRTRYPFKELIIMDDCSDGYTRHRLMQMNDPRIRVISQVENVGYLTQVNQGLDIAYKGCDSAVIVNSDVLVTDRWLEGMLRCASSSGADLVNPLCNNAALQSIPLQGESGASGGSMSGGRCYIDAAFAVALQSPKYPEAVPSIGQCLFISKSAWVDHGPFDRALYHRGYGEECELWANVVKSGGRARLADNVFVYHESHATHGKSATRDEKLGFDTFMSRHSDIYRKRVRRAGPFPITTNPHRKKISAVRNRTLPVGFVANDIGPWGGVMCMLKLVEGLGELGFDTGLGHVRTSRASKNQKPIKCKFGPYRFRNPLGFKDWSGAFGWKEGIAFATHFHSVVYLEKVIESTGITPAAFWQDREDFFEDEEGNRSVQGDIIERYCEIPLRIANAKWVAESAEKDLGVSGFTRIPVGVDCDLFYPSIDARKNCKFRVISMWRPITKRRGHERIIRVYKRLREHFGNAVSLEVYGQEKGEKDIAGLIDVHHGWLDQKDISFLLRDIDVVLEPSDFQGFGLPGLEAMASGCLLVSTDNMGIHEYGVDGANCFICKSDGEIVERIIMSLENYQKTEEMRHRARKDALLFDWKNVFCLWAERILSWDVNWPDGSASASRMIMDKVEKERQRFELRL